MQRPRCARATGGNDIPDALVPGSRSLVQKMGSTWEDWGFELRASGPLILKSNMLLYIHLLLHPHRTISCSSSPSPPHPSSNHQSAECSTRSAAACPPVLRPSARSGHGAGGLWWLGTLHHCPSSPSSLPRVCITIRSVIQNSNIFESCPVFDCKQIIKHIQKS